MPLNYDPVRLLLEQYQTRPAAAAAIRLEREVQTMLRLDELESVSNFEWTINEIDMWWSEVLTYLRFNKSAHARDEFIGALIDILNERNLLPDEPLLHTI